MRARAPLRALVPLALALAGLVAAAPVARAQVSVARQLAAARQYLLDIQSDSAGVVLRSVLDTASKATAAERAWGYSLMALVRLEAADRSGALTMFRSALRADVRLPTDSLAVLRDLQSEAEGVLQEARRLMALAEPGAGGAVGPRAALAVRFEVPAETTLAAADGRLRIVPMPNRRAHAVVTMALADLPGAILWRSDTVRAGAAAPVFWPVRSADGRLATPGRYLFAVTATDSAGEQARAEWTMVVERAAPDTQPLPGPVRAEELKPDTVMMAHHAAGSLLLGAGIGAAAIVLPGALGRAELKSGSSSDGTAFLVAGSATVAGIIGFFGGRRAQFVPENARYNADLRQERANRIAQVTAANARAQEQAPFRVRLERSGP